MYQFVTQFGYQFETQYLNQGRVQGLFEFIPTITGLEQGLILPSMTVLHGLRDNKTGIEFIENLRKSLKHQKAKVLLISGCLTKDDTLNAMKLGVKDILVKPFNRQRLMEKFNSILQIEEAK